MTVVREVDADDDGVDSELFDVVVVSGFVKVVIVVGAVVVGAEVDAVARSLSDATAEHVDTLNPVANFARPSATRTEGEVAGRVPTVHALGTWC